LIAISKSPYGGKLKLFNPFEIKTQKLAFVTLLNLISFVSLIVMHNHLIIVFILLEFGAS